MDRLQFSSALKSRIEGFFDTVARMSATPGGEGVTRIAYSPEETQTLRAIEAFLDSPRLEKRYDAAGNLVITLPGRDRTRPGIAFGSHADSVPSAGNYDGLAGVAAGLAILGAWLEADATPECDLYCLAVRAEEVGLIGSASMLGLLRRPSLEFVMPNGKTLAQNAIDEGFDVDALVDPTPKFDPKRLAAWFEMHIEQGPKLDLSPDKRVGLVSGMRGIARARVSVTGKAAHAGAIERPFRRDAAAASVRMLARIEDAWVRRLERHEDLVATCGKFELPDAPNENKIPGRCVFSLEERSLNPTVQREFLDEARRIVEETAREYRVEVDFTELLFIDPQASDEKLADTLLRAAAELGVGTQTLASGAGHDAQSFAQVGVPFAMLFIANQNGSHNPYEAMRFDDFWACADVLQKAIAELAGRA